MALHLPHGIHLQHLAAPGTAEMTFIGRFHTDPTDAIADLVALFGERFVLALGDRLGVAEGVGRQRSMGIEPQDVHIHLRTLKPQRLLSEPEHLLRLQIGRQIDAIAITGLTAAASLIEHSRIKVEETRQTIPQVRPGRIVHQTRLHIKGIGQLAGGQHPSLAIEQTTTRGGTGHQADAVLIRQLAVALALQHLQPHQTGHHRCAHQQDKSKQHQRLLAQTALTLTIPLRQARARHSSQLSGAIKASRRFKRSSIRPSTS